MIVGKFLTKFFEMVLVNHESSTQQPNLNDQSAFHNGRLAAMLAPSVDAALNRVPCQCSGQAKELIRLPQLWQDRSRQHVWAGRLVVPVVQLGGPAGGGQSGHAFQGGAGPFPSASGAADYTGGGPACTPSPAFIPCGPQRTFPPRRICPSSHMPPLGPQGTRVAWSAGSHIALRTAAERIRSRPRQRSGAAYGRPSRQAGGRIPRAASYPAASPSSSRGPGCVRFTGAHRQAGIGGSRAGRSRAALHPTNGEGSVRCGCKKVADPHSCREPKHCRTCFRRCAACPWCLPDGQRDPRASIGDGPAPSTLVLRKIDLLEDLREDRINLLEDLREEASLPPSLARSAPGASPAPSAGPGAFAPSNQSAHPPCAAAKHVGSSRVALGRRLILFSPAISVGFPLWARADGSHSASD